MSDQPVRRVARYVRNHPWAILEPTMDVICEILDMRMRGITLSAEEIQARLDAVGPREIPVQNGVAVIPLYGVLAQKMNMFTSISGGTSTEQFVAQVRRLVADQTIRAIVIDADSPGGTVDGIIEAADALYALRGQKPIVAVANPCIASAAYWLLSQCDEIVCSPSGQVGSIGVFCVHEDVSRANEMLGYKPTYIYAGAYKVEQNPDQPLGDEARSHLQQQIDTRYQQFVNAVARGREVTAAKVKGQYGEGRMLLAQDALSAGMVDRIATLEQTVARVSGPQAARRRPIPAAPGSDAEQVETPVVAATTAAPPDERVETLEPDDDGGCPAGYTVGEDGLCHLVDPEEDPVEDEASLATADAAAIAAVLAAE